MKRVIYSAALAGMVLLGIAAPASAASAETAGVADSFSPPTAQQDGWLDGHLYYYNGIPVSFPNRAAAFAACEHDRPGWAEPTRCADLGGAASLQYFNPFGN